MEPLAFSWDGDLENRRKGSRARPFRNRLGLCGYSVCLFSLWRILKSDWGETDGVFVEIRWRELIGTCIREWCKKVSVAVFWSALDTKTRKKILCGHETCCRLTGDGERFCF